MAKQTIYNAGIYVRLSQEDMRAGESLSIEHQKLILTKYVREQGWNLVDTYVDDGFSGTRTSTDLRCRDCFPMHRQAELTSSSVRI